MFRYEPHLELDTKYRIYYDKKLGEGGFGKVYSGLHVLTQEPVAIKEIEKDKHNLPYARIRKELECLKLIRHQNVARLYEFHETEKKLYLIIEYCDGGEIFDYLLNRAILKESEARFYFRQLLQAVAYIHSRGICHRDIKAENILLTRNMQIKLIDFGLAARPPGGLNTLLHTHCGSFFYAAPEVINQKEYVGCLSDVWSLGVVLYILLTGNFPFHSNNDNQLGKLINAGVYEEPAFLSPGSKALLKSMLQVNTRYRINVKSVLEHAWITRDGLLPLNWQSTCDDYKADESIARTIGYFYGKSTQQIQSMIQEWNYDYMTSTYLILRNRQKQGLDCDIKMCNSPNVHSSPLFRSPTYHRSLEKGIDDMNIGRSHEDESDLDTDNTDPEAYKFHGLANTSTTAIAAGLDPFSPRATPVLSSRHKKRIDRGLYAEDKENVICPKVPPQIPRPEDTIYGTPSRKKTPRMGVRQKVHRTASYRHIENSDTLEDNKRSNSTSAHRAQCSSPPSACSTPHTGTSTPITPISASRNGAASNRKGPKRSGSKISRRIFTSLERGGAKIRGLLTPKKSSFCNGKSPVSLKLGDGMNFANVSTTSSNDCKKVLSDLSGALIQLGLDISTKDWAIRGTKVTPGKPDTIVELEVVWIATYQVAGVRRRRLQGDAMIYKTICEKILAMAV